MRHRRRWAPLLALPALLIPLPVLSQETTGTEELLEDLVVIEGGKMTIDDAGIFQIRLPAYPAYDVQVRFHAEAPATGVISRDNFVSWSSTLSMFVLFTSYAEAYQSSASEFLQNVEYRELKAPIGNPDLELNIYMTAEGLQFEIVNTVSGETNRFTQTWEDALSS